MTRTSSRRERLPPGARFVKLTLLLALGAMVAAQTRVVQPPTSRSSASEQLHELIPQPDSYLASLGSATAPLGADTLVDAALIASGLSDQSLPSWRSGIESILAPIREAVAQKPDEKSRAEALLELLHERGPFRSYSATATTLIDVFNQGTFNCVSSAVVYLIAARELGIPCSGVRTSDHAFCVVAIDGKPIDVETTTAYGFDPGTKREFIDAFGKVTGYSYVPPGDYARREGIDDRRLVSLILSNRAALLESSGHWPEALALAVDYYAMEPDAEGRDFALGRVNNFAAALMNRGGWKEARQLATEARARWGDDKRLTAIANAAADSSLVAALSNFGTKDGLTFAAAKALVEGALASGEIGDARAVEFLAFLYGNEANRIGRSGDWLGAAALADEGAGKTGGSSSLKQAAAGFRHNFVATVHNNFARLFNARLFASAVKVAEEGLAKLPGDPTLGADLKAARDAGD